MKSKNNLDEMQEQELLKIEHTGFWIAFWGLFAAIMIHFIVFRDDALVYAAGESVVFFLIAGWMVVQCQRHGIWDRRLQANAKTNLLLSLAAGLVCGLVSAFAVYRSFGLVSGALITLAISFIAAFILCFAALSLCAGLYNKRRRRLENEPEPEEAPIE